MRLSTRLVLVLASAIGVVGTAALPGYAEGPGTLVNDTGVLTATVVDDFDGGSSRTELDLVETDPAGGTVGRRALSVTGVDPSRVRELVGRQVVAKGRRTKDGGIEVTASGLTETSPGAPEDPGVAEAPSVAEAGPKTVRVLAVTVRFKDTPSASPVSSSVLSSRLFTGSKSVRAYYDDLSDGQWDVRGRVVGPYTVSRTSSSTCESSDYYDWARSAEQAAIDAGVDTSAYTHLMVVWGRGATPGCGWAGLGQLPGNLTWINASDPNLYVLSHELGHNFGEHHASSYNCTGGVIAAPASCRAVSEYGDPFTTMGAAPYLQHATAREHYQLISPRGLAGGEARTVRLAPADTTSGVRELRVSRPDGTAVTVEYRRPTGLFDAFASSDPVVNGVTLRLDRGLGKQTYLFDTTSSTSSDSDAPLRLGRSVIDPVTDSQITLTGLRPDAATVQVTSPRAVRGLRAIASGTSLTVAWTQPSGVSATSYLVSLDGGAPVRVDGTRWTTAVEPGRHRVVVRAVDGSGMTHPAATTSVLSRVM
ncbi:hypothetical protein JQN72_13700 [Phycicoccus sp. CSK15P-2]|uniref:hypothetical protein n=1 Tax=Phycicoccus sp. CSK15P-2 TaxID=2807627 RepID=UPI00195120A6|nr:hypothetical protein [Phycicoccus sp. CSK15P-2]MBM6405296.1 hypothetical protein [Phycicoccus sp. CSK15P-2]